MGLSEIENMPMLLYSESLFISVKEQRYESLPLRDILYFQAEGAWVDIVTKSGKRYRIATNLGTVLSQLQNVFVRVSRKHVVNLQHISAIQGNQVSIGETEIPVGPAFKEALMAQLPILRTKISRSDTEG